MHWQDNFPFEARRSRHSGSRSGCVGGWRPSSWPGSSVGPRACSCSAASARPVAACATIAGRFVSVARGVSRGAQAGGVRPLPPPGHAPVPGGRAPLRGAAAHEAERRSGARGGGTGRVGPLAGWHRLRLLRQIGDELVPGVEQFLLVDDV